MKLLFVALLLTGCGYSSVGNNITGQVKGVKRHTPLLCDNYIAVDLSLGVMRNGVGSMSSEDVWLQIMDKDQERELEKALVIGKLVRINFDQKRFVICPDKPEKQINSIELLDN